MINVKLFTAALGLIFAAAPAEAAIVSITQPISVGGDLALDTEDQPIYLLAAPPVAVSIEVQGVLDWSEPFFSVPSPGPLETISSSGSLGVYDEDGNGLAYEAVQGTNYQTGETGSVSGALSFDVSGAFPAGDNSSWIGLSLEAGAGCTGCELFYSDDVFGIFNGTLTTTFSYAPLPEPSSDYLFGTGVIALIGLLARPRKAQPGDR
jgi:hypothetical protein